MTISAPTTSARVVLLDDDETPEEFVIDLLVSVFARPEAEAHELVERIDRTGRIECGPYPTEVARALQDAARGAATAAGHSLQVTSEPVLHVIQGLA
jgi:ATP-dependent Clp protease adapter protein ClpS